MCPSCGEQSDKCQCKKRKNNPTKGDGEVRVEISTKGRRGKGVSLISGIPLEGVRLKELAKNLNKNAEPVEQLRTV